MIAVGDLDDFGGEGAETPVQDVVDAGKGHGGVVGIAEAPAGFGPGAVEQIAQRTAGAVERSRVEVAAENDGMAGTLDLPRQDLGLLQPQPYVGLIDFDFYR